MFLLLLACGSEPEPPVDNDRDGVPATEDCDDDDPSVYPGAVEIWYDGKDGDCDGADDYDQDGDGYRYVLQGGEDCNDADATVNPDAVEVPYDGRDNDCDPTTLENDLDRDGHPAPADCDDADPARYPLAPEAIGDEVDQDCGGDGDGASLEVLVTDLTGPRLPRLADLDGVPALAYVVRSTESLHEAVVLTYDPLGSPLTVVPHGAEHTADDTPYYPWALDLDGDDVGLWLAVGFEVPLLKSHRASTQGWILRGTDLLRQNGPFVTLEPGDGPILQLDVLAQDDDGVSMAAATEVSLSVFHGQRGSSSVLGGTTPTDASLGTLLTGPDEAWSCGADGCARWSLPADGAPTDPLPVDASEVLRGAGGIRLVRDGPQVRLEGLGPPLEPFTNADVLDADVALSERADGTRWVAAAAIVQAGVDHQVVLAFGRDDAGVLSSVQLGVPDLAYRPDEVAIWSDADEIVLVVTADSRGPAPDQIWVGAWSWAQSEQAPASLPY